MLKKLNNRLILSNLGFRRALQCEATLPVQAHRICPVIIVIAGILMLAGSVVAQESTVKPSKFEEFVGEADVEDIKARLDLFAIELKNYPNAEAQVIIYRTRTQRPVVAQQHLLAVRGYLINRGVAPQKLVTVDGGMTGCFMYELWIVPPGASPPARRFVYTHTLSGSIDGQPAPKRKQRRSPR